MFKSFTFWLFIVLIVAAIVSLTWLVRGGAADGAGWVFGISLALALVVAILSRVLGGAWFTDNAGGH